MEQKKFEYLNENGFDGTMAMDSNMNSSCCNIDPCMNNQTAMCQPIQECPKERVCHRYICYEVPQD